VTDPHRGVLIPFARFLEYQDRRRKFAAELVQLDHPPTLDAHEMKVPAAIASAQPLTGAETS
jgi:hypothetical protein